MDYYSLNGHIIAKTKHSMGHPATTTAVGTAIGYGKHSAINSMAHLSDHFGGKKKDKSSDFGIGHLGDIGLGSHSGMSNHEGFGGRGEGSERDPFDDSDNNLFG